MGTSIHLISDGGKKGVIDSEFYNSGKEILDTQVRLGLLMIVEGYSLSK